MSSPASLSQRLHTTSSAAWVLRIALAIVFVWFGALKPLGLSPADALVRRTVFWLPGDAFLPFLGIWEMAIGISLLWQPWLRVGLWLLFVQMAGTLLPLFLLPDVCFRDSIWVLTLEGQYIVKNVVLLAAAWVVAREQATGPRSVHDHHGTG